MEKIKIDINWSGDNYTATLGSINGVVITTNKDLEKVKKEFKESFEFHIESSVADGDDIPLFIKNGDYELDFKLQISAILHKLDGVITRASLSRFTGINERQLGHYIQRVREPTKSTEEKIKKGILQISKELSISVM